ncbi:MAG: LacI family transcriptional regulator [Cyclobacteriaceae bacterium]|nr:MAG: LacI family transcriptional regulator [Cyclobacteriaceae bacterium]
MTIKDIAKEANVSAGTVDRVIHDRPGVSNRTKAKIQKILDKHNFERNVLASTLAYKRKYTIALLIPYFCSDRDFWYEPNKGAGLAINEIKSYGVVTHRFYFKMQDLESFEKAQAQILALNPDGVVFAAFFYSSSLEFIGALKHRKIPFVLINIDIESQGNLTFIGQDSFQGGKMAGKLLSLNLTKNAQVAILRSRNVNNHNAIDARIKGFMSFFSGSKHLGFSFTEIYFDEFSKEKTAKVLLGELEQNKSIQGIFVPSSMAFHVAEFLEEHNLEEIRLVGFDAHVNNLKYLKTGTIDFLIDQDPMEQGYMGVKLMFEFLLFKKRPRKIYNSAINIVTKENSEFFRSPKAVEGIEV